MPWADSHLMPCKTIICDFDGTIAEWGKYPEPGSPTSRVKESLQELKDMGFEILISSCRTSNEMSKHPIDKEIEKRRIEEYLLKHEIPYDEVLKTDKPIATFYIDDRAIRFNGNWQEVLEQIKGDSKVSYPQLKHVGLSSNVQRKS